MKNWCKFRVEKKGSHFGLKSRFGRVLGSIWEGFGEGFGASWGLLGRFGASFFYACICIGLQKCSWRHLGGIFAWFWGGWDRFGEGFGGAWEGFSNVLGDSDLLSTILDDRIVFCWSSQDFGWCSLLLAAAQLKFKFKISSCFCLLLFAWPCVCTTKYGTHFELKL